MRAFENRALRRIFGPSRDENINIWKELHSEASHNNCFSLNVIRMLKSRRMRRTEHVACMRAKKSAYVV
jgi:hypothetical protein